MPDSHDVAQARNEAQVALFKQIEKSVPKMATVRDLERLARTFRYAAGGAQPGSADGE